MLLELALMPWNSQKFFSCWPKDYLTCAWKPGGAVAPGGLSKLALGPPAASLLFQ